MNNPHSRETWLAYYHAARLVRRADTSPEHQSPGAESWIHIRYLAQRSLLARNIDPLAHEEETQLWIDSIIILVNNQRSERRSKRISITPGYRAPLPDRRIDITITYELSHSEKFSVRARVRNLDRAISVAHRNKKACAAKSMRILVDRPALGIARSHRNIAPNTTASALAGFQQRGLPQHG